MFTLHENNFIFRCIEKRSKSTLYNVCVNNIRIIFMKAFLSTLFNIETNLFIDFHITNLPKLAMNVKN